MGYLSQYFCEKSSLEAELSALRNSNNSELVAMKQEEIRIATRDAYLYAVGMIVASYIVAVNHTWVFYNLDKLGMMLRIVMTGAIFEKVYVCLHLICNLCSMPYVDFKSFTINHRTAFYWTYCKPCLK